MRLIALVIVALAFVGSPALALSCRVGQVPPTYHGVNSYGQKYTIHFHDNRTISAQSTKKGGDPGFIYDYGKWSCYNGHVCVVYGKWGSQCFH